MASPELPAPDPGNAVTWTEFPMLASPAQADFTPPPAPVSPVLPTIACDCGKRIRPRIEHSGKKIKCPGCRKVHLVPAVAGPSTSPAAPVPRLAEAILELEKAEAPALPKDDRKKTLKWLQLRSLSSRLTRKKKDITSSTEADARKAAIEELGKSNDPRAAALIRPFLQDEWLGVREAAATALGRLGDHGSVLSLARLLMDESPEVRRATAVALGILGDPRTVRPLLLLAVEQPQLRFSATEAIARLGPSAVKPLSELADVCDPGIRAETAVALGKTLSVSALEPLGRLLRDPHTVVRAFAAEAAGRGALAEALPLLIPACGDPAPVVRINACVALGAIGDKKAAGTLISLLYDPDGDVRTKAVVALCELKPPEAIPYLHPLLGSEDPDLRCRIAEALGKMGDTAAIDALLPLLRDPHAAVRMRAAAALGDLQAPQAVDIILELMATDTNEILRQRCAEALGEIRDPRAIRPLEQLAVTARGIETRMAAYRSLGHIRHPDAIEFLEQALHSEFTIRCRAVIALGEIGDSRALPGLLAMLRDPAAEVRHHAAVALGEIGDANALKPLEDRLNQEEDQLVRRGLAKALTQLGDPRGEKLLDESRSVRVKRELKRRLARLIPIGLRDQFEELLTGVFSRLSNPRTLAIWGGGAAGVLLALAGVGWFLYWMFGIPPVYRAGQTAAVAIGPQGRVFVAGTLDALSIFDPQTGQRVASQKGHLKGTYCMDFSDDGSRLATGGEDHLVRIRDGSTGKQRLELQGHQAPVTAVRFNKDGTELISLSSDGVLIRWDPNTGTQKGGLELPAIRGTVGFSPDLKLVAVGQPDGTVHLISTSDGKSAAVLKTQFPAQVVVFNLDGSMVAATGPTSKGAIAVWKASGKSYGTPQILTAKGAQGFASLAFSPDGAQLVAGGAGDPDEPVASLLWDLKTGKSAALEGILPSFTSVAWNSDGKIIAGGGILSSNVLVWDPATGHLLKTLTPPPER